MWSSFGLDWDAENRILRGIINDQVVLEHEFLGSLPAATEISRVRAMYSSATTLPANTIGVDGVRSTIRRRFAASTVIPDAAPTDDGLTGDSALLGINPAHLIYYTLTARNM